KKKKTKMKQLLAIIIACISISTFAQNKEKEIIHAQKKANNYVYQANDLVSNDNYIAAEMEYRKAISTQPNAITGTYNLGNSYYKKGKFDEALFRHEQTAKNATSKAEKHKAFHNIGNILMQSKQCKLAAEAFKNALRNDPTDNETRYNYVLAKECAQEQQKQDQEDKKEEEEDKKEEEEDKKEDQEKKDKEEEGDKDKKEGEDKKEEEGKPKDDKQDQGEGDKQKDEQKKPKPQPGQLTPQQVKNLLKAMNDQEQKVQDKMNAQKQKGSKVQTEKDW
ncbi:MAG: aerotolerance regulator BatC, partial [Oceanihabitans sp.]